MMSLSTVISASLAISIFAASCTTRHQRPPTNAELRAAGDIALADGTSPASDEKQEHVVVNRGMGMLQGLGIGALTGLGTGALLGYLDGDDGDGCSGAQALCLDLTAGEKAGTYGFALGFLGGITGTIIGAIRGQKDVYEYGTPAIGVNFAPTNGGGQFSLVGEF